ncbi:MAG: ribosome maturation factor RimM [Firmicutes bacterium]|nr:ribosome maturation factor RimM [Bacillota bacterium]
MCEDNLILVGVINGAHGIRGLVKVKSLSDNPARFVPGRCVYIKKPANKNQTQILSKNTIPSFLIIEKVMPYQGKLLIAFAGIESRDKAAALLGAELLAEPDSTLPAKDAYYHYQLLGLSVYEKGALLGEISDILSRPANDIYIMKNEAGKEIWIPALKTVIKNIDLGAGYLEVELPPGLYDN